jgi:hypothetical protein
MLLAVLSSSMVRSQSITESDQAASLYDKTKGMFLLCRGGLRSTFVLISVGIVSHMFLNGSGRNPSPVTLGGFL